jgi:PTS system N-acetylglucosamine-specific IIC component
MAASSMASAPARTGGVDRVLGPLQNIGRSLMLPIAVLPAAALLLRLGQPDLLDLSWMAAAGDAVFSNLPIIFALGIAVGLSGGEGAAGLAGLVGYFVFISVFNTIIPKVPGDINPATGDPRLVPDPNIKMGVLAGFLVGLVTAGLYRRFHAIRLPNYLGFFSGKRFVPIITALTTLLLGLVFGFIWPPIQSVINTVGQGIVNLGPLGTGIYGALNRLLIPIGLHHVLNSLVWFQLGTYTGSDGLVTGDLNRYFAGDPSAGNFMAGFFPMMMFGLPAACFAMIRHARFPKVASGILLSAALASFLTGITEPIEFAFMFVAPVLYVVHALLTGTALAICTLLNIKIGFGFSAGAIDYALNFTKANSTNAWMIVPLGLAYGVLYYGLFSFFIKRFNLATPGRGESDTLLTDDPSTPATARGVPPVSAGAPALATAAMAAGAAPVERSVGGSATVYASDSRGKDEALAEQILDALGGPNNVQSCEGCITRLRLNVNDADRIDDARLKQLGASGVIKRGKIAQVVMGTQSDHLAGLINRLRNVAK